MGYKVGDPILRNEQRRPWTAEGTKTPRRVRFLDEPSVVRVPCIHEVVPGEAGVGAAAL